MFRGIAVLFSAYFKPGNYTEALRFLSFVIAYFQYKNVFTRANTPQLDAGIDKLIFEMANISPEQLNNIWASLGAKYMPSVVYKMRMVTIDSVTEIPGRLIKDIEQKFGVNMFDRTTLAFVIKDKIQLLPLSQLQYAFTNGFINSHTLYFNNLVQTKEELENKWIVPIKDSWLSKKITVNV